MGQSSCAPWVERVGVARTAVAMAGLALLLAACQPEANSGGGGESQPPEVTVAKPVMKTVREEDEFVGRFAAIDDVAVRARVSGYLDEIHFEDGEMVERGDLLFTIDPREFEAALARANAQLETAQAAVTYREAEFARAEELAGRGTIPQSNLDEARNSLLSARAAVDEAEALKRTAELDLDFSVIEAPVSGRIDRNRISVGNLVTADATVLTSIVSLDPIEFYFDIDERSMLGYARDARERGGVLQEGAGALEVNVQLADERQGPFTGTLDFAENRIDQETGTIRLRARFDNPDFILQPGLFGRVTVPASLPHEAVMIPDSAVASDQNRRIVYVVDAENAVGVRPVRPGPTIDGYRVIREGLSGEETVVINGLTRLRPGMSVSPTMEELPPVANEAS